MALRTKRQKSVLGAITLSVAVIAAGVMLPFDLAGVWHLHVVPFLAVLLVIVGLGLIVGTFVGRSRGLIVWGVLLSLIIAIAAAVPAIDARGTGDVAWRPQSLAAVPAGGYRWAAGNATLDLTGLPAGGDPQLVQAQLGAGNLIVRVPAGTELIIDAHVGLGSVQLPGGLGHDGVGVRYRTTIEPDSLSPTGTLQLRLDIGAGTLEVVRAKA